MYKLFYVLPAQKGFLELTSTVYFPGVVSALVNQYPITTIFFLCFKRLWHFSIEIFGSASPQNLKEYKVKGNYSWISNY